MMLIELTDTVHIIYIKHKLNIILSKVQIKEQEQEVTKGKLVV